MARGDTQWIPVVLNGQLAVTNFTPSAAVRISRTRSARTGEAGDPTIFHLVVRTLQLEACAGLWVAVDSAASVRCHAATLAELLGTLAREHIKGVEVMRAPDPSEPIAY